MEAINSSLAASQPFSQLFAAIDSTAPVAEEMKIPVSRALEQRVQEQQKWLEEAHNQQQQLCTLIAECEREVKKIKGESLERPSVPELLRRETELAGVWTLDGLMWQLYTPPPEFVYSLKLVSAFNPVLFKQKKFA